jgi:hypothetical protein
MSSQGDEYLVTSLSCHTSILTLWAKHSVHSRLPQVLFRFDDNPVPIRLHFLDLHNWSW